MPALTLAVLLGGVTACGSETPSATPSSSAPSIFTTPPNVFEQQRADGVTALLDTLTGALTSGDRAALEALIDPLATRAFRESLYGIQDELGPTPPPLSTPSLSTPSLSTPEPAVSDTVVSSAERERPGPSSGEQTPSPGPAARTRGRNLVLRSFQYRLAPVTGADRVVGGHLGLKLTEANASDTWVTPVTVAYALGGATRPGVDEPVVELPQEMAFVRYGDDWKVLGDGSLAPDATTDSEAPVRAPELAPWAFPGLRADDVRTGGGTSSILSYPGTDRTVAKVRAQLAPAVAAVSDFWGDAWARRAVVQATATPEQFAGFTRTAAGETSAAAAATVFSRIDRGNKRVIGQRIVLSPAVAPLSSAGVAVVLRHELTHVATRLETADNAPMWLTEGVAEYVGRRGADVDFTDVAPELSAQVAAGDVPEALPSDEDFAVDTDAARLAYQSAWSFAAFVADKYGEEKLKLLYRAVAQGGSAAQNAAALSGVLGVGLDEAVAQWQAWLRKQVR